MNRDLQDHTERSNLHITEIPTGEEKDIGADSESDKMITKNIVNLIEYTNLQKQT